MGTVLGLPLTRFWTYLSTEPLFFLKYTILYYWLKKITNSQRLHVYDPEDNADLTKLGAVIPDSEIRLEQPRPILKKHESDSILLYGSNSAGDTLLCSVSREVEGHVSKLLLVISDGPSFHPVYPEAYSSPGDTFNAHQLRIKCVAPMRKWRISFSGFLREFPRGTEESKIVHVKFSFICITTSFAFDLQTDIAPSSLAEFLARESKTFWPDNPESWLTKYMDSYVQAVNILGTVSVSGQPEQEIFLWGAKLRTHDIKREIGHSLTKSFEFFGYTKEGQLIYVAEYECPKWSSKLNVAHYLERCTLSWPVVSCILEFSKEKPNFNGMNVKIITERSSVSVKVHPPSSSVLWPTCLSQERSTCSYLSPFNLQDGDSGCGLVFEHTWSKSEMNMQLVEDKKWRLPVPSTSKLKGNEMTLPLNDGRCLDPDLAGAKGSFLSSLLHLSNTFRTDFKVPDGFVLTTAAWNLFLESKPKFKAVIEKFEREARSVDLKFCESVCSRMVELVETSTLPSSLMKCIERETEGLFGNESQYKYFAVRSSCKGEDSEETSAAGQLKSLLGVKGTDKVCEAVLQCWASQFSFTATQYKIHNGLELVSPMAVVVQEMVNSDVAGVLFTCDPVTGNPQKITLTANYGLGESVMSAYVDPDTLWIERNENNEMNVTKVHVGEKKVKMILNESGTVIQQKIDVECSNISCISPERGLQLAEISINLEETFGFPVDVEWAFCKGDVYLLQVRPVTTFDSETDFELAHAVDHGMRAENEFNTKANIGEVMPDAFSHLGLTYIFQIFLYMFQDLYGTRNKYIFPFNPFYSIFPYSQNHVFINMPNFVLRFYNKNDQSALAQSSLISGFGRLLDNPEMFEQADRRNKGFPGSFVPYQFLLFIIDLLYSERELNNFSARLWREEMDLSSCRNSKEMYLSIWKRCVETVYGMRCQLKNTFISSIYNSLIMSVLATANKGWDTKVYTDFALILSSCGDVESVDIPYSIKNLVQEIKKYMSLDKFKEAKPEDMLQWLEITSCNASSKFKEFIRKHGHRGTKDYDIHSKPWREDKVTLIKVLQESADLSNEEERKFVPIHEVIAQLKVQLSWKDRLFLRFLIPLSRRAVVNRERGKSLIIKHFDLARRGFWQLAELLEEEGRLPDKDLMFFLTNHEVFDLTNSRSPALVQRAIRRRQIFPVLNLLRFPEISRGIPVPINVGSISNHDDKYTEIVIQGTPVSPGIVEGKARVVNSINQASSIKAGEILIAYSTDVSWTPYFPLLKGVATELGGLISHGAVVAREYGLPCVVGTFNATLMFKSGDSVLLDANQGCLKKISDLE